MLARLCHHRRWLATAAIVMIMIDAVWIFRRSELPPPYFEWQTTYDGVGVSCVYSPDPDARPEPTLAYIHGKWSLDGQPVKSLKSHIITRVINTDSPSTFIVYRLDPDATMIDYAQSSRDVWRAGAEGATACIPQAYQSVDSSKGGLEITRPNEAH